MICKKNQYFFYYRQENAYFMQCFIIIPVEIVVMGPLMFLLYVNDIADKISPQTRIKLFADDCLLYRTIDTKQDHKQLQQDLNTLVDWSHTWLMTFNAAKCHLLKITRKTKFLDRVYN